MNKQLTLLQIYFSFRGRVSRSTYWSLYIAPMLICLFSMPLLLGWLAQREGTEVIRLFIVATLIPMFWISLAVQAKRWHDSGKSGWLTILFFIPGLGFLLVIINGILAGEKVENRYGVPQI